MKTWSMSDISVEGHCTEATDLIAPGELARMYPLSFLRFTDSVGRRCVGDGQGNVGHIVCPAHPVRKSGDGSGIGGRQSGREALSVDNEQR